MSQKYGLALSILSVGDTKKWLICYPKSSSTILSQPLCYYAVSIYLSIYVRTLAYKFVGLLLLQLQQLVKYFFLRLSQLSKPLLPLFTFQLCLFFFLLSFERYWQEEKSFVRGQLHSLAMQHLFFRPSSLSSQLLSLAVSKASSKRKGEEVVYEAQKMMEAAATGTANQGCGENKSFNYVSIRTIYSKPEQERDSRLIQQILSSKFHDIYSCQF